MGGKRRRRTKKRYVVVRPEGAEVSEFKITEAPRCADCGGDGCDACEGTGRIVQGEWSEGEEIEPSDVSDWDGLVSRGFVVEA